MNICIHARAILHHSAPKLVFARCKHCGRRWSGDPSNTNSPKWVMAEINRQRKGERLAPARNVGAIRDSAAITLRCLKLEKITPVRRKNRQAQALSNARLANA